MSDKPEHYDADDIIAKSIRDRGDMFKEFLLFMRAQPKAAALNQRVAGYVHQYKNQEEPDQALSLPMRELIATVMLAAKGEDRFAPNHVRKLWREGVTNAPIFEAAFAMATVLGWTVIGHTCTAVQLAGDPNYREGQVPEGGEPKTLKPFAELTQGRERVAPVEEGLLAEPEWQDIARLDPELAQRAAALIDHALMADDLGTKAATEALLGPGVRELIAIAGLCARGQEAAAARHMKRAVAYSMTPRQILEAISCVIPMTGSATMPIGVRAMRLAGLL
jgi:alkylhydroperoxidase/carboxymuconolactone decarboxylase family protein YurZ